MAKDTGTSGTISDVDASEFRTPMGSTTPLHDAAEFNASFGWETTSGLPKHIQDYVGEEINGKPVFPEGQNVPGTVSWQLDSGWAQDVSDGVITFGFFDGQHAVGLNNNPQYGEGKGYTPFSEAQKTAARAAIANWDELISAHFVEIQPGPGVSNWGQQNTDILLANTYTGPAQAWAYYPGYPHQNQRVAGDVWIADPRFNTSNSQFLPGQYGLQTLNHELGHSLGLSHPGNYNYGDDNDGDGVPDPITYDNDAFYFQDSNQYTIMSYFDTFETGAQPIDYNVMRFLYPSTPMVDDVFVVQQKYGADTTTRTGNTTYGFNASTGVSETMSFHTGEMATIFTIWDAAGNDTLDLSGYYTPSVIDLREGGYTSAGGWGSYNPALQSIDPATQKDAYLAAVNGYNAGIFGAGTTRNAAYDLYFGGRAGTNEGIPWSQITNSVDAHYLMQQNIGIAYGAIIENAIGGYGADRINGNWASNSFTGNAGADTFIIADYTGKVADPASATGYHNVVDTLHDRIKDFTHGQDHIDLTSFDGVTFADLNYNAATHDLTIHRHDGGADFHVQLDNVSSVVASDFIFG